MIDIEAQVHGGPVIERFVCHPRRPLVAALDAALPGVHIWDCAGSALTRLGSVDAVPYADPTAWGQRTPGVAWHPDEPVLMIASEGTVARWTPEGVTDVGDLPATVAYRFLAFSPDGTTLWASPTYDPGREDEESSDVIDPATRLISAGRSWDTGATLHPAGTLIATLQSEQGATNVLFATGEGGPTAMRLRRRALVLDCDGYETPEFSPDGRYLAVRGDAYGNSVSVFEFPSLVKVLAMPLGEPRPNGVGYPPREWIEQMWAWSRYAMVFGRQSGGLWIGTPTGKLIEVDVDTARAVEHDILAGGRVTAIGALATGGLVIAGGAGELLLASEPPGRSAGVVPDTAAAYLAGTSEVPEDGHLEPHLVLTDGTRTWTFDELSTVDTATADEPTWLQIRAAMNNFRQSR